jgi:CheY-like chemotaxis protein
MVEPNQITRDALRGWNVLIVDDMPDNLEVAYRVLRYYGAQVHRANNGMEALGMARALHPDIIIADLMMPVMDGWEMMRRIKADSSLSDIPVIALTGMGKSADALQEAAEVGFFDYLTKPLTPATFVTDLLRLMNNLPHPNYVGTEHPQGD